MLEEAEKEIEMNAVLKERSFETKLIDRLKLEIPECYTNSASSFTQINMDVQLMMKYYKSKKISSVNCLSKLRKLLPSLITQEEKKKQQIFSPTSIFLSARDMSTSTATTNFNADIELGN